jgi:hypothetical protein
MAIKVSTQSSGSVVTPLTGKVQIFVDSSDGTLKLKDETSTILPVNELKFTVDTISSSVSLSATSLNQVKLIDATIAPISITLPSSPPSGSWIILKLSTAATFSVSVSGSGGSNIDGNPTLSLNTNYMGAELLFSFGDWYLI